jgi:hypothetical protein
LLCSFDMLATQYSVTTIRLDFAEKNAAAAGQ